MLTKGSDQILEERLTPSLKNKITYQCLEKYANKGLRTLVISSRVLENRFYYEWKSKYDKVNQVKNHKKKKKLIR